MAVAEKQNRRQVTLLITEEEENKLNRREQNLSDHENQ